MQTLSSIIYEPINSDFGYGNYLGLKVIIMTKNGYINATKLCTLCGKLLKNWYQNSDSVAYLQYKNSQFSVAGIPATEIMPSGGINDKLGISGTYYHPEIIVQIAN